MSKPWVPLTRFPIGEGFAKGASEATARARWDFMLVSEIALEGLDMASVVIVLASGSTRRW